VPDGFDQEAIAPRILEFPSEAPDVDVYSAGFQRMFVSPDRIQDITAGKNPARVFDKQGE
jgi:hypothetical protein